MSVPRIVTVDSRGDIAGIVRGAMTLLDRRFILVEVPNGESALEELSQTQVDLLVTAFNLPDLNGTDLAARAVRASAGTPVVILADQNDPEVDSETLKAAAYTYLVRPVGEPFLRALRIGLDGEAAVVAQEGGGGNQDRSLDLGPIPEFDHRLIQDHVLQMMRDTGAIGSIVADRLGRVIHSEGATGYFDKDMMAALVGPGFARTVDMRSIVGGNAWSMQYYDGDSYDIFALALGLHYFVVLIFDGTKRPQYGPVTRYGREEAEKFIEKLGADAWSFRRAVSTQTMTTLAPETTAEEVESTPEPQQEAAPPPQAIPDEPIFEPVADLDVDKLFNQSVDESQFDELFSSGVDTGESSIFSTDDVVSFDDAMDMGILDE